jgi:hypothetical protein
LVALLAKRAPAPFVPILVDCPVRGIQTPANQITGSIRIPLYVKNLY